MPPNKMWTNLIAIIWWIHFSQHFTGGLRARTDYVHFWQKWVEYTNEHGSWIWPIFLWNKWLHPILNRRGRSGTVPFAYVRLGVFSFGLKLTMSSCMSLRLCSFFSQNRLYPQWQSCYICLNSASIVKRCRECYMSCSDLVTFKAFKVYFNSGWTW